MEFQPRGPVADDTGCRSWYGSLPMRTGASGIRRLFTSESVTEGHPDKVADQISDAVLDAALRRDPEARVACETLVSTDLVLLAGEITVRSGDSGIDFEAVARKTVRDIGYTDAGAGFAADDCEVQVRLDPQSPDIALGVDTGGAGDQGLMFGYACRETGELMPVPIVLAHRLTRRLAEARREGEAEWIRPDGKSQVTVEYDRNGAPSRVHTIVVSTQHAPGVALEEIRGFVRERVVRPTMPGDLYHEEGARQTKLLVNPTGRFEVGGPPGRLRAHRPQDHRGHLRGSRPPRRRGLLGQGSDQGGPLGELHGPLRREEPGRRRHGGPS